MVRRLVKKIEDLMMQMTAWTDTEERFEQRG